MFDGDVVFFFTGSLIPQNRDRHGAAVHLEFGAGAPSTDPAANGFETLYANKTGIRMNGLTIFGLFSVTAMLVFYALEKRSPWFILAFAGSCIFGSAYGFLQGAWPFGLVEAVWSGIAVRRWWLERCSARELMLSPSPMASNSRSVRMLESKDEDAAP